MPRPIRNLKGQRFFRLVVIERAFRKDDTHHAFWKCKCDCGNEITVRADSLLNGHAKSCGCYLQERYSDGHLKTHGHSYDRIYSTWQGIKQRCLNTKCQAYDLYGGRGITICDSWLSFENFYDWALKNGYADNLSIDRINVNGNYEPSNCRWANCETQNYNKRDTRRVEICGEKKTLLQISREYGIPLTLVRSRYIRYAKGKCSVEQLIQKEPIYNPGKNALMITIDGVTKNCTGWEKVTGVNRKTIANRYKKGIRNKEELFKKTTK